MNFREVVYVLVFVTEAIRPGTPTNKRVMETLKEVEHIMNNNDERDYEEEAANRRLMEEEAEEFDDDGDDDDEPADGESFDGGFGPGSYFSRAMQKDD